MSTRTIINKKDGAIVDLGGNGTFYTDNDGSIVVRRNWRESRKEGVYKYDSFGDFMNEWEEYEYPNFWYIDETGFILCGKQSHETDRDYCFYSEKDVKKLDEVGNRFKTKEEAELVLKKRKALENLRKKGFKFTGWTSAKTFDPNTVKFTITAEAENVSADDLNILFKGRVYD